MENFLEPNSIEGKNFPNNNPIKRTSVLVVFFLIALGFIYINFFSPPKNFPAGTIFNISEGESLRNVSLSLEQSHLIRSRVAFEALTILFGGEKHIIHADYYFETKLP